MKKTNKYPCHHDQLVALRRVEGQVRGVQKMVEKNRYCIDILTQLHSIKGAVGRIENNILEKHLGSCVSHSLAGRSAKEKDKKISEILGLLKKFRKQG